MTDSSNNEFVDDTSSSTSDVDRKRATKSVRTDPLCESVMTDETIIPCGTEVTLDDEDKWTCYECVGRTGEKFYFTMHTPTDVAPTHCPSCGKSHTVETVQSFIERRQKGYDTHVVFKADRWL